MPRTVYCPECGSAPLNVIGNVNNYKYKCWSCGSTFRIRDCPCCNGTGEKLVRIRNKRN